MLVYTRKLQIYVIWKNETCEVDHYFEPEIFGKNIVWLILDLAEKTFNSTDKKCPIYKSQKYIL